jgi:surface antigen
MVNRLQTKLRRKTTRRRIARLGFWAVNIGLLAAVMVFVLGNRSSGTSSHSLLSAASSAQAVSNPIDQVSAVDIAQTVAVTAGLSETPLVNGQVVAEQTAINYAPSSSDSGGSVVSKPQILATTFKSNKDIHDYTVQQGDTLAGIATRFNINSDSIKWSNNLATNTVVPGTNLLIPPVDGIVYTVKPGDTSQSLAQTYNASQDLIVAYNDAEISGLQVGERIIIPGGKKPAPTYFGFGYGAGYGVANVAGNYTLYDRNNCTWWVALRWAQTGRPIMPLLGNASQWYYTAKNDGLAVSSGVYGQNVPKAHAAAVTSTRGFGHVVFVESVNDDGSINISEMNLDGWQSSRVWYSTVPAATAANYLYVY